MKELLDRIDSITGLAGETEGKPSVTAESPALFLYAGDRAVKSIPAVKKHLKRLLLNSRGILHAAASGGDVPGADYTVSIPEAPVRGESVTFVTGNAAALAEFNGGAKTAADRLMMSRGFPRTDRCFLFIIADPDSSASALLPEFVMLFSENAHIRVHTCLFVLLGDGSGGLVSSAAFFRELEVCRGDGFIYECPVMLREGQHIGVRRDGAVFDEVFFLEMYRSDMKLCPRNEDNNARIAAVIAALLDSPEPVRLPSSPFLTAGISILGTPARTISHIMYKSVIDLLAGKDGGETPQIPAERLFGYDAVMEVCDTIMQALPDISTIVSVMPAAAGKDPEAVKNTNVRNILEYFGGADEEYFNERFVAACERMADNSGGIDAESIFRGYVDKGTLRLSDVIRCTAHDGSAADCLGEVTDRLGSEEAALNSQLAELLAQPCPEPPHGLFSKPSGCDIIASAVSVKYGKLLEILRTRTAKRLVTNILGQLGSLSAKVSAAADRIKAFSGELTETILRELYDDEGTLTDAAPFVAHYSAVSERSAGDCSDISGDRSLYDILMSCGSGDISGLTETAFGIFRRMTADTSVREIFSRPFDTELYERYRSFEGGKDPGWVDARLVERLRETSRADLRYNVFQPANCLFFSGDRDSGFVKKMLAYEDPAFESVKECGIGCGSYAQLAVYGVPSADCIVCAGECDRVYEKYVSEHGDIVYIDRTRTEGARQ
ncbi:MAG: hypothetical protein K5876_03600 [Ruminiclostridium sp.]|nr:hypothetical protein [Ruminiclostridium sp.]